MPNLNQKFQVKGMKKHTAAPLPAALAAGLLEDHQRALFLVRKLQPHGGAGRAAPANQPGIETVELPCVLLQKGENPVASLAAEFRRQTGIDAQVHEVLFERRHNAGTRKRKVFVPVLVFKVTAKNPACRPSSEFSGYKWLERADLAGYRRAKNCLWL